MTQCSDENTKFREVIAYLLDVPPRHLYAHVIVAASIPAMHETISTTIACPISLTQTSFIENSIEAGILRSGKGVIHASVGLGTALVLRG
jgi:hypothetical protein